MLHSFAEIQEKVKRFPKRTIAIVAAHDKNILEAASMVSKYSQFQFCLIGDEAKIQKIIKSQSLKLNVLSIIDIPDPSLATYFAIEKANAGEYSIIAKGSIKTAEFLKAIINRSKGLRRSKKLSHLALFELTSYHKLLALTDAAVNITPNLDRKVEIIINALEALHKLGYDRPKTAILSATEVVNAKITSSVDAQKLMEYNVCGKLENCIIQGPLAFDNAISAYSVKAKEIQGEVAGDADLLVVPELVSGNILYKSLTHMAKAKSAAVLLGTKTPVALASRADNAENKYFSLLLSILVS